ncbi:hypothetical protein G9F72_004815 [Clostridium estertheticum]|uniref:hypothetical protein n=1 Tax=Clostridium estertheticum TaxID=238834 RepID=UPI0013E96A61|nr:hypothetical protein [Clostridium estertheticum]MBZ9685674.1 hypothetical protein [Clostridium estertheticum]
MKTVKVIKKVKVIQKVILVIVIILMLLDLFDIINGEIINLIELLFFGIMNILDGYCSYINNKKRESISLFLVGIFLIVSGIIVSWIHSVT